MGSAARADVNVVFRATGVQSVRNGLRLVRSESRSAGEAAEGFGHGAARSLGEFTRGLGNLASQGQVTTLSMREITGSLFGLTSMLGPGGILIPILASVGFAIYEVFNRTRTEIEATRRKAEEELAALQRSANLQGLAALAQRKFSGDPYAVQGEYDEKESDAAFRARQLGQRGIEQEIASKRQLIAVNEKLITQLRGDTRLSAEASTNAVDRLIDANNRYKQSIKDLSSYLPTYTRAAEQAATAFSTASKAEGERLGNVVAEQLRQFHEGMKTKELQPTLNNQFANDLFGVLLPPAKVHRMGELVLKDLLDGMNLAAQRGIAKLEPAKLPVDDWAEQFEQRINALAANIKATIIETIGGAIDSGFQAAFARGGNFGSAFSAITQSILAGLGQVFEDVGKVALVGLIHLKDIKDALMTFMPELGFPGALALIALGAFLKSTGSRVGSSMSQGSGGYGGFGVGSYGGSLPGITNTGIITAASSSAAAASRITPMAPVIINANIIGTDDPRAQRNLIEMVNKGLARSGSQRIG